MIAPLQMIRERDRAGEVSHRPEIALLKHRAKQRGVRVHVAKKLLGWADVTLETRHGHLAAAVCYEEHEAAKREELKAYAPHIRQCRENGLTPVLWVWVRLKGGGRTRAFGHRIVAQVEPL